MAKKRKKDKAEKEEYEFRPPEFDEKEFLKKEISDTKTAIKTIGYAIAFGAIAGVLTVLAPDLVAVAFLLGVVGMVLLKYVYPFMGVDTSGFLKKTWIGNLGTYFFTFLAVWVLLLNVPFSDHAEPTVEKVIVWVDNGITVWGVEPEIRSGVYVWDYLDAENGSIAAISKASNVTLNITAKVTDNGKLSWVKIAIGTQDSPFHDMTDEGSDRYGFKVTSGSLSTTLGLMFYVDAEDGVGNSVLYHPETALTVEP